MDVVASLIRLQPGSEQLVKDWAETLSARKEEALQTLREEGVQLESWFQLLIDGGDYLLCFMRGKAMSEAVAAAAGSTHPIDAYHRQFKQDTWVRGGVIQAKLLIVLVNDDTSRPAS